MAEQTRRGQNQGWPVPDGRRKIAPMNAPGGKADCVRRLADFVCTHRHEIRESWRALVTGDPDVPTDRLTPFELEDDVPELLDRIVRALEEFVTWRDDAQARGELAGRGPAAARHLRLRLKEGYSLPQVLRELHYLREAIVSTCEAALLQVVGDGARVIHTAIDAAMIVSATRERALGASPPHALDTSKTGG